VKQTFFGGSLSSLVSFFAREEQLTDKDIAEILNIIEKKS
jgi:predicted transcriptional regulator